MFAQLACLSVGCQSASPVISAVGISPVLYPKQDHVSFVDAIISYRSLVHVSCCRFVGGWPGAFAICLFIFVYFLVFGVGLGAWASVKQLADAVNELGESLLLHYKADDPLALQTSGVCAGSCTFCNEYHQPGLCCGFSGSHCNAVNGAICASHLCQQTISETRRVLVGDYASMNIFALRCAYRQTEQCLWLYRGLPGMLSGDDFSLNLQLET